MTAGVAARVRLSLPPFVIARSDSDAATPIIVRTFQGVAESLSLLAMPAKGFAYASPVIMRTAATPARITQVAGHEMRVSRAIRNDFA